MRQEKTYVWFLIAVALFLVALVYAFVLVLSGARPANASDDLLPWMFAIAGLLALLGWRWERAEKTAIAEDVERERRELETRLRDREDSLRETREELETARHREADERRGREQLTSRLEKREEELRRERYLRSPLGRSPTDGKGVEPGIAGGDHANPQRTRHARRSG